MMTSSTKVAETSSREVVNGFGNCRDLSDSIPLYTARGIYLKPLAKIHVSINLPQLKTPGKTISTWEVMEKVRLLIRPDEFASLKVVKNTLEFIRFKGDLGDKSRLQRVLGRLDGQRLNLAGFPNVLKVKAVEMKDDFPTRHSWDSYFRDAKHMNELKAGERPDTIHISGLPVKWFSEDNTNIPSEPIITNIFKKWGTVRRVDIPAADPYRSRMRLGSAIQKFSYEDGIFFDAYIQYVEYMDFVKSMDALRGMKLLKKEKEKNHLIASIKVDFDKTKHMSDSSVSHREFERKRLIAQDNLAIEKLRRKEEEEAKKKEAMKKQEELDLKGKESRRRKREEKRKQKALTVIRKQEEDKVSLKIAREEKKLIKAQRQLESIRLLDTLFDRIKIKQEKNEIEIKSKILSDKKDVKSEANPESINEGKVNNLKRKVKKEKSKFKKRNKKDKKKKKISDNISSESDENKKKSKGVLGKNKNNDSKDVSKTFSDTFAGLPPQAWYSPIPLPCDPTIPYGDGFPRLPPQAWYYNNLNSGMSLSCNVRGLSRDRRGVRSIHAIQEQGRLNEQYYKYFASLVGQDYHAYLGKDQESDSSTSRGRRETDVGRKRSRSKSRSKSKSRRVKRSNSKKRTRSISKSRSRTQHRTRSSSKSRSHSKSRSRDRLLKRHRRSKSRVRITRAKSRSNSTKRRSRSSTWSLPKSPTQRSCSWSKNADGKVEIKQSVVKKTDKQKKTNKITTKASPSTTPKEKKKEEIIIAEAESVKPG